MSYHTNTHHHHTPPRVLLSSDSATMHSSFPSSLSSSPLLLACVSMFQATYNFQSVTVALAVLRFRLGSVASWEMALAPSIMFLGGVHGVVMFGFVADRFSRSRALFSANLLCFLCALLSGLAPNIDIAVIWVTVCRYFLGVGVGGVLPACLIIACEGTTSLELRRRRNHVVFAYFWSVPGAVLPYLISLCLVALNVQASIIFRIVLGVGCIPALISTLLSRNSDHSHEYRAIQTSERSMKSSLHNAHHWKLLVGTACAWLCHDICRFGPYMFAPTLISRIFGLDELGQDSDEWWNSRSHVIFESWHAIVWAATGAPAIAVTWLLLRFVPAHRVQILGFFAIALSLIALAELDHINAPAGVVFGMFCVATFAINMGPGVTVVLIPCEVFPTEVRGTFIGISAGVGMAGAGVMCAVNEILSRELGSRVVMYVYATVAVCGGVVSWLAVRLVAADRVSALRTGLGDDELAKIHEEVMKYTDFI
eukprot:c7414_g1_i1.p1 GENE.c7414_g1_i1~~c7414_g1_i1.p1  ORF type:complete len:564 (-),score=131.63 c7414_g1_i1:200-1642(-)